MTITSNNIVIIVIIITIYNYYIVVMIIKYVLCIYYNNLIIIHIYIYTHNSNSLYCINNVCTTQLLQSNNRSARVSNPFVSQFYVSYSIATYRHSYFTWVACWKPTRWFGMGKVWCRDSSSSGRFGEKKNLFVVIDKIDIGVAHCPCLHSHVFKEPKHAPTNALQIDGQKPRSCTACYVAARCHTFLYLCFTLALASLVKFRMPLWGLSEKTKTRNLRGVCFLPLPAIEGIVFQCF